MAMNHELIKKLMTQKSTNLVSDLKALVSVERKATGDILHYFYVVGRRRIYAQYNYPNIYKFSMGILGYTEHETQRRVSASRLLGEIPELEEKLNKGELSLTAVSIANSLFNREHKAQNTFSLEKKTEVLKSFENKSVFECEKEVLRFATVTPPPKEKVRHISEETVQITLNVPKEFLEEIETLKNHYSHSDPGISTSELLRRLVKAAAAKKDPAREPRRTVSVSKQKIDSAHEETSKLDITSMQKAASATTTPLVRSETRKPSARLCKSHNQLHAINTLGFEKMDVFLNPH
jgi:hypothetical protein